MLRSLARPLRVLAVGAAVGTLAGAALAQGTNKVAAESLFDEGRKLMAAGKTDEACVRFADSQRLDPAVGTLLNLANCYEVGGKLASAWVTYRQAASDAAAQGQTDRVAVAKKRAAALEPRLSKLTVRAPDIAGLVVKRDGQAMDRAELGIALPIDAGTHLVEASAPGRKSWSSKVDVGKDAATASIDVPDLAMAPVEPKPVSSAPPPPTSAPPPASTPPRPPPAPPPPTSSGTRTTVGLVALGIGVVGVAAGTVLLVSAKSKYDSSLDHCPNAKNLCDATGVSLRDDARSLGTFATVGYAIGAVGLVSGAALLVWPSGESSTAAVRVTPTLGGLDVRGAF